jgi:hypothetical protein
MTISAFVAGVDKTAFVSSMLPLMGYAPRDSTFNDLCGKGS